MVTPPGPAPWPQPQTVGSPCSKSYLGVVGRLARDNPFQVWRQYDKQFRQMAAAVLSSANWGDLNFQFLQWAKQTKAPSSTSTKEICRQWNEGQYCQFSSCTCKHSCAFCGWAHRASSCPTNPTPYIPPRDPWVPPTKTASAHHPQVPPSSC